MVGKTVLITGCSRGIGLEFVRQILTSSTPPEVLIATCRNPDKASVSKYEVKHVFK